MASPSPAPSLGLPSPTSSLHQLLFYPTAIGSEPPNPGYSSYPHWVRVMQGHAGANMVGGWAGEGCGLHWRYVMAGWVSG